MQKPKKIQLIDAQDWLFDHGIVFDILPDTKIVKEIAQSDLRTQILACLAYLEHKPAQENMAAWGVLGAVTVGLFTTSEFFTIHNAIPWIVLSFFAFFLGMIVLAIRDIYHAKLIAAWAASWRSAITEGPQPCIETQDLPQPYESHRFQRHP